MNVRLKPELEKFLDDQVKAGNFPSTADAVEAGVARLMLDTEPDELDQQDLDNIRESLAQMRRGEVVDAKQLHAQLRDRHLNK
jgi:Arc/MetJ-type ribon-helix-helix transcriptional regulator